MKLKITKTESTTKTDISLAGKMSLVWGYQNDLPGAHLGLLSFWKGNLMNPK
jgi:hypothetical protein